MEDIGIGIALLFCIFVCWLIGITWPSENQNVTVSQNIVEIKDCRDIKLDTVSYNFIDSTYVIQVNIKY